MHNNWITVPILALLSGVVLSHDPTIYLKQTFPLTQRIDNYNTMVVEKDQDCLLPCVIDKKPKGMPLQWVVQIYASNMSIPISTDTDSQNSFKYQLDKPATNIWRLKIQNVQESDQGLYICRVQLHNFQFANVSRMIKVVQKPQVIDIYTSSNMLKEEGDRVELKCAADGIPKPLIIWQRAGGGTLPSGGRELAASSIIIDTVDRSHKGIYKCIAKNTAGTDERRIHLDVNFSPKLTTRTPEVFQAPEYNRELKCEAAGNPVPTGGELMWFKDGTALTHGHKYDIETYVGSNYVLMKLRVKYINDEDYGEYNCYAENAQGNGQTAVTLSKTDQFVSDRRVSKSGSESQRVTFILAIPSICLILLG